MGWLERTTTRSTPTWLKVVVVVQGFFFFATSGVRGPVSAGMILGAAFLVASFTALVGLWRLRRWAVYALIALLAFYFATRVGLMLVAWRGVLAGMVVRSIALVAGLALWKKLT